MSAAASRFLWGDFMNEAEVELIHDEMSDRIVETAEQIAIREGAESVTVRKIMRALNITNRVFYNRFHNVGEVLALVYKSTVMKIRESLFIRFDPEKDFFEQVIEIVTNTLVMSYENKRSFNQYVFETDSVSDSNYEWWKDQIKKIIEFAKSHGFVKNLDSDIMSYSIWCFIRGYNADALGRGIPRELAVENFKYSFRVLLDGMRA